MTDSRLRELERLAAGALGDEAAENRVDRAYARAGETSPTRRDAYGRLIRLLRGMPRCPGCGTLDSAVRYEPRWEETHAVLPIGPYSGHFCSRCGFIGIMFGQAPADSAPFAVNYDIGASNS
jgi:hypothetical protein